jgi:hypothetical protein
VLIIHFLHYFLDFINKTPKLYGNYLTGLIIIIYGSGFKHIKPGSTGRFIGTPNTNKI